MRLGLMQPYFFPYLEYFRLINDCDLWVAFDTAQFSRGSWINRNRIINRETGWTYISVPVSRDGLQTSIRDARMNPASDWKRDIMNKVRTYEPFAPNYQVVRELLVKILDPSVDTLGALNTYLVREVCRSLGIDTKIVVSSELDITPPEHDAPGGWPISFCKQLGAKEYLNASGGHHLYSPELFLSQDIVLRFHEHIDFKYDTGPFEFVPDLSIIDVLMWVDAQTLRNVIHGSDRSRDHPAVGVSASRT